MLPVKAEQTSTACRPVLSPRYAKPLAKAIPKSVSPGAAGPVVAHAENGTPSVAGVARVQAKVPCGDPTYIVDPTRLIAVGWVVRLVVGGRQPVNVKSLFTVQVTTDPLYVLVPVEGLPS